MLSNTYAFSGFSINDSKAAYAFYKNILGLDIEKDSMGLQLRIPDSRAVFMYEKSDHSPASFTVLNFVVKDIDEVAVQLSNAGVQLERYELGYAEQDEKNILRGIKAGQGPDIAWFKDPAGNILSILQNE